MWIKLCLLLLYICLLFLLSRVLETISWCDLGTNGVLSRQFLDPMRLSVAKLKCLLDNRGVSYDGIVEKLELSTLVDASGPVSEEDEQMPCQDEATLAETNFTSGAHFIEQVEDAKDSVWLVQVVTHTSQVEVLRNKRWKNLQRKASLFGVRTGILDCSLDYRYCHRKGWRAPVLLLALPSQFEKKANVVMYNYSGPATESAILKWIHEKLDSRISRIKDLSILKKQNSSSFQNLRPELRAILFTQAMSAPLFFSALSVKFPGRIKFGMMSVGNSKTKAKSLLDRLSKGYGTARLPICVISTTERNYIYGFKSSERFSFSSMERFLKFLYPCLNDIFIISFCVANVVSWFEFFVSNCGLFKRLRKLIWCALKYNLMVIMLWLPIIGLFQMPYLDQIPLWLLKLHRIFTISDVGAVLRGDFVFFLNNPIYVYMSFVMYLVLVTLLCKKYRQVEDDSDDWFNFRHMQTLTHLGANNLFEPMRLSGYDLVGGFEVFGSRFSQPSLWLQPSIPLEYIQHLPTWQYTPQSLAARAAQNVYRVESAMATANGKKPESESTQDSACQLSGSDIQKNNCLSASSLDNQVCSAHVPSSSVPHVSSSEKNDTPNVHSCSPITSPHSCPHSTHQNMTLSTNPISHKENTQHALGISSNLHTECTDPHQSAITTRTVSHPTSIPSCPNEFQGTSSTAYQNQSNVLPNGFHKGFMESTQCVICLEDYVPLTMLCGLPCGHVFHETCIISWLNREKHFCPMCRWPSYKLMTAQNPS